MGARDPPGRWGLGGGTDDKALPGDLKQPLVAARHGRAPAHAPGPANAPHGALEEQLEFANKSLIDERKRIDELLHQLADGAGT